MWAYNISKRRKMKYIRSITSIIIFMSLLSLAACGTENKTGQSAEGEFAMQETQKVSPAVTDESKKNEIKNTDGAVTDKSSAEREESVENEREASLPGLFKIQGYRLII